MRRPTAPRWTLIRAKQSRDGTIREALGYVNVVAYLTAKDLYEIAARPDVLSIQPRPEPRKFDERQDMIVAGQLTGNGPTGPATWRGWRPRASPRRSSPRPASPWT